MLAILLNYLHIVTHLINEHADIIMGHMQHAPLQHRCFLMLYPPQIHKHLVFYFEWTGLHV